MTKTIVILNGPNLPRSATQNIVKACAKAGVMPDYRQTDDAATLLYWVRNVAANAMILNPAADIQANGSLYHDSIEAMSDRDIPVAEVYLGKVCCNDDTQPNRMTKTFKGMVGGLGDYGYVLAINALANRIEGNERA